MSCWHAELLMMVLCFSKTFQLTADESIFLSPFQKSEKSLPGSAKVWRHCDQPDKKQTKCLKKPWKSDVQAEYDLAVSVGSQGSAVACKERSVFKFSFHIFCQIIWSANPQIYTFISFQLQQLPLPWISAYGSHGSEWTIF